MFAYFESPFNRLLFIIKVFRGSPRTSFYDYPAPVWIGYNMVRDVPGHMILPFSRMMILLVVTGRRKVQDQRKSNTDAVPIQLNFWEERNYFLRRRRCRANWCLALALYPNPQIENPKTQKALAVYWLATKTKQTITQWVHNARLMNVLPYKLDATNDLLTSRAGYNDRRESTSCRARRTSNLTHDYF